jgi:ribosomal protein S7|tara:strand:- start:9944 stop:10633 length:690 start_codon:yes stop_codon:yes gene_type:complete
MTLKNNSFNSFTQQISNKVLLKEKLNNDKNILKLKYLFKYLGFKKKKLIVKVRHNKIFLLKIKKKIVIRKNSNQKFKRKFNSLSVNNLNKLNLYKNFISFIFKSGKKHIWEKIISNIFLLIKKNLKISQNIILLKIFLRLYSKIEIKKIKTRKKTALVPVFISVRRRFFLALKWLLVAVNKNKLQISLKEKLFLEIFKLTNNKSCDSLKQLELNNENIYLNRANFHYRW